MPILFTQQVFDQFVHAGPLFTDASTWELLGSADKVVVEARTSQPSTNISLDVYLNHSNDGVNWPLTPKTTLITGTGNLTGNQSFFGSDNGSSPLARYVRLDVKLTGTTPTARVQLYVTGRSD